MPTLAFRRRDPWWGLEGPAARRRHRYERFVSTTAFLASLVALGGAGWPGRSSSASRPCSASS